MVCSVVGVTMETMTETKSVKFRLNKKMAVAQRVIE